MFRYLTNTIMHFYVKRVIGKGACHVILLVVIKNPLYRGFSMKHLLDCNESDIVYFNAFNIMNIPSYRFKLTIALEIYYR